jgi:hypothetical protein
MRRNLFKILFVLTLFALPGADIECEDGEFEFDWPSFGYDDDYYDHYHGYYVEPVYYYEPCCWYW